MVNRDIIVIGGSAGSGQVVRRILGALPRDLSAAVFVVIHRGLIGGVDYLPVSLGRLGSLHSGLARDGETFETGRVYVAPSDGHLLIEEATLRVDRDVSCPSRDSIDALFRSAACVHGSRVIGLLVSGMLQDGAAGFWQIRKHGGITIAQDPAEAQYSSIPENAMRQVPINYCLRTSEIAAKLEQLVNGARQPVSKTGRIMIVEDDFLIARDLETQLDDLGYAVVGTVESGEDVFGAAAEAKPDLVIMDVRLAGKMTGTEAATRLRERCGIPIVFLTAYTDQDTFLAAQASGPCAFLSKPYHAIQLHSVIQLALSGLPKQT